MQAIIGPTAAWSTTEHLLAAAVNELKLASFQFRQIHFKAPHTKPTFIVSPGTEPVSTKPKMTLAEMRERLADPRWVPVTDKEPEMR